MKKTVSVNIKGINFLIEEDAYETLRNYLDRLERQLAGQQGSREILEDIELRVAELCQEKLGSKKEVIELVDIEMILSTLGDPEDFIEEDQEKSESYESASTDSKSGEKRLYRDLENAKIAGICAGIANYIHADVMVVRILFLLFFFIGGFGIPLYIILWLVIPRTESSIDRLKMRGRPITVDNVREEVEQAASRVGESSKSFARRVRREGGYSKGFSRVGNLITRIVGLILLGMGAFFLILFSFFFFAGERVIPIQSDQGFLNLGELGSLVLSSEQDVMLAWIGICVVAFSAILFLISNGTYVLMRIRNKWTRIASITLFLTGLLGAMLCVYLLIRTAENFSSQAELEREITSLNVPELIIDSDSPQQVKMGKFTAKSHRRDLGVYLNKNRIHMCGVSIDYRISKDSSFHVKQTFLASGKSYNEALERAKHMNHEIVVDSGRLVVPAYFNFPKEDRFREQDVRLIIEIPKNRWVRIGNDRLGADWEEPEWYRRTYLRRNGEFRHWD
ncbi:MAG: PspC domain-containing protein [Bacteroidetes bacterium]|nr:MAG: PspC domain-containing protein [Bacteroidota bacterium]